ncbi:HAD-IA family hydrolase [Candidatus Woesearchaeota archaeon]|nr:HAD-IA family hydrolase [Candidatus Woesearchaeota archaeon]
MVNQLNQSKVLPIKYSFNSYGHENLLAMHRNTLELTKDSELSKQGDCIVGIKTDFKLNKIKKLLKYPLLKLTLKSGREKEEILFKTNPKFSSNSEIVIRITDFESERTLGVRADKSSKLMNRKLVKKLQKNNVKFDCDLEPQIKCIITDLDDTIEDFQIAKNYMTKELAKIMCEKYGIYEDTAIRLLNEVDYFFSHDGMAGDPQKFNRIPWFKKLFDDVGIKWTKKDIDFMVKTYWELFESKVKLMPGALSVITKLKKKYKLVIMTDSDGERKIKIRRIKLLGIYDLFDLIVTADDIGQNKPNTKFYNYIFKKMGVKASECVMMGDKPEVDLELAKKMGLRTIWAKHGSWAEQEENKNFHYVDCQISGFKKFFEDVDWL